MSDVTATYGLDYAAFRQGIERVNRTAVESAATVDRSFTHASKRVEFLGKGLLGIGAAGGVVAFVASGMKSLAEFDRDVAAGMNSAESASKSFARSLATDVMAALGGADAGIAGVLGTLERYRAGVVNFIADNAMYAGTGHGDRIDELRADDQRSKKAFDAELKLQEVRRSNALALANMGDDQYAAKRLQEEDRHQRARKEISSVADADLRDKRMAEENRFHAAAMKLIEDRAHHEYMEKVRAEDRRRSDEVVESSKVREQQAKELADDEKRRSDARRRVAGELVSGNADVLRLSGEKTAADLVGIRLDYENKIADVLAEQALSDEERARLAGMLADQRDRILAATQKTADEERKADAQREAASRKYRTLDAGSGGGAIARAVFGPGAGGSAPSGVGAGPVASTAEEQSRQTRLMEQSLKVLQEIAAGSPSASPAVFN